VTTRELYVILGLSALSVACFIAAGLGHTYYRWRAQHPVETPPAARHRADEPTQQLEQLHAWPAGRPQDARVVEVTEQLPVVHVEVSETSTPLADVFVPLDAVVDDGLPRTLADHVTDCAAGDDRHLDRIDGALRGYRARLDASGANTLIDRWLREAGELPGLADARRAAYPDCDDPSIEMDAAELAALLDEQRAGSGAR
jgi:hypothetical protein